MKGDGKLLLEFVLPQAQLWWPNTSARRTCIA